MRLIPALLAFALALPANAGQNVVSGEAGQISVTVYRDTNRSAGDEGELDLEDLRGYAVITETRQIALPAGDVTLRFEGVANGIIPATAIVSGLPGGVIQKNRDARLLSPAALVDGSLGRRLHLKRTDRKTGKVTHQDAQLVAGPEGGIIVRTAQGYEALGCAGLSEGLIYDGVPKGLTARPTLSVDTHVGQPVIATVQLTYLAENFDWAANYVLRVHDDTDKVDVFAWMTVANGNGESFADAQLQAVAGKVDREATPEDVADNATGGAVSLECWPMDITSTHPRWELKRPAPPQPATPTESYGYSGDSEIIVTAQRRSESVQDVPLAIIALAAEQVNLGDLKLYRIPEPVTVAANAQKQIALLQKDAAPFTVFYRPEELNYVDSGYFDDGPAHRYLRLENKKEMGLGIPLPMGNVALFAKRGNQWMLISEEGWLDDTPVGEKVEIDLGESAQVEFELERVKDVDWKPRMVRNEDGEWENEDEPDIELGDYVLAVTNANPYPVDIELPIQYHRGVRLTRVSTKLVSEIWPTWKTAVPANGKAELRFTVKQD